MNKKHAVEKTACFLFQKFAAVYLCGTVHKQYILVGKFDESAYVHACQIAQIHKGDFVIAAQQKRCQRGCEGIAEDNQFLACGTVGIFYSYDSQRPTQENVVAVDFLKVGFFVNRFFSVEFGACDNALCDGIVGEGGQYIGLNVQSRLTVVGAVEGRVLVLCAGQQIHGGEIENCP